MRRHVAAALGLCAAVSLLACAPLRQPVPTPEPVRGADFPDSALLALLPVHAIVLGEQHDAPDHPSIHRRAVALLAARGQLGALVVEMSPHGASTRGLPVNADEADVKRRLAWDEPAWPWANYGPAIMAAVRAGVEVAGGNLPRALLAQTMGDAGLDGRLSPDALQRQRRNIRDGHCGLLPESQIVPMARIQIARDASMADTVHGLAVAGKAVLLLAGAAHADRRAGVPVHWPGGFQSISIWLRPLGSGAPIADMGFDRVWNTKAMAARDYCAEFKRPSRSDPGSS
jgi:uncharacterized iron-regulated protein